MSAYEEFKAECIKDIAKQGKDKQLKNLSDKWFNHSHALKYSYHFEWMGRPIIQYPQDIVAMHELIWSIRPDLIIETGIAHGGSLIFSAAMLELNTLCGGPSDANVLGIDIDIRDHNRAAIEAHPLAHRISMIQGSSVAPEVVAQVASKAINKNKVLVCLDSNHTYDHVLAELRAYAPLVTLGSYCVVFDTVVEDMPLEMFLDRPWSPGNSPKTAVMKYLESHPEFSIDHGIDNKLLLSAAPSGYLKRIS
jgi:cephalosporin hydroxylase